MKDENFLYQHKEVQPTTKTHTIRKDELETLRRNAIDENLIPCYIIDILRDGSLKKCQRWYLVDEETFEKARRYINESNEPTPDIF